MIDIKEWEQFEYKVDNNLITITKYKGEFGIVTIPSEIEGLQVVRIGAEAFRDLEKITKVSLPGTIHWVDKYAFCGCNGLTEFYFVDSIEELGAHCFYNCRGLEKISLRGELKEFGDGVFKNCGKLTKIEVRTGSNKVYAIKYPLDSLLQDVTISIQYMDSSKEEPKGEAYLYFPKDEVYYSYYTSRLNDKTTFGVGNNYHNCIGNGLIDYKRYDNLFLGAKNFLAQEVLIQIALYRLMKPYQLQEEHQERYMAYCMELAELIVKDGIAKDKKDILEFYLKEKMIDGSLLESCIIYAMEKNRVETTSLLMQYKNENHSKKDMKFEL